MSQTTAGVDHNVTSPNTVAHWVLYTLDALEADHERDEGNEARERGTYPEDVYEYAAGDDSIVFKSEREVQQALSDMARDAPFYKNDERAVNRRTDGTDWEGPDVKYRYRLTEFGRRVLMDLGVPEKLPNRHEDGYDRELPGARPAHQPGWWMPEYDLFGDEWDIRDHDWLETDHPRIFYKDEGDERFADERGYASIPKNIADLDGFEDVTFVVTIGPRRMHDMAYAIRDPWRKVVQLDIYSPMAMHRSKEDITANFEMLVRDLRRNLKSVHEEYKDDAPAMVEFDTPDDDTRLEESQ